MGALAKLAVIVVIILVIVGGIGLYLLQYKNLEVDLDKSRSGVSLSGQNALELVVVIEFTNTGSIDLVVPPTDFEVFADGIYAGPGESEGVTVPAGGKAWATATVDINAFSVPAAYLALVDAGKDTIRLKGEAHVQVGPFNLDFPFDESFSVDA
jgi:LEA14-like dessication related protein